MTVLDSSGRVNQAAIDQARPQGVTGFIRYLGNLSVSERDLILGNKMDLGVVKEWNGNEIGNPGAALQLAQVAVLQAREIGFPQGGMIWLALADEDYTNPGVAQQSIDNACGYCRDQGFLGGVYMSAGLAMNTHGWDGLWQTMSRGFWLNGHPIAGTTLFQRYPQPNYGGVQFDTNDVMKSYWGQWHGAPAPPPPPAPVSNALVTLGG